MFYYRIRLYGYVQLTAPGVRTNILKEKRKKLTHSAWSTRRVCHRYHLHMYICIYTYMYICCLAPSKQLPSRQPGSGPTTAASCGGPACYRAVRAKSLSHLHTDRPLGRPRGPLLQQHVGLLVAERRRGRTAPPCCRSCLTAPVSRLPKQAFYLN